MPAHGVFSNEPGLGSAAIAHAAAQLPLLAPMVFKVTRDCFEEMGKPLAWP